MPSKEYYEANKERILARARERYDPKLRKMRYEANRPQILSTLKVKRHFQRQASLDYFPEEVQRDIWHQLIEQREQIDNMRDSIQQRDIELNQR